MARRSEARLEEVLGRLRGRGSRITDARRAVLRVLLDHDEHLSAEELADAVRARHPDVHLSTVYRSLEAFQELGVVTHVHLGHGRATYHLTEQLHHHAVCEDCGRVLQLPDSLFADMAGRLADDFGFEVDAHHFALSGRCAACAGA